MGAVKGLLQVSPQSRIMGRGRGEPSVSGAIIETRVANALFANARMSAAAAKLVGELAKGIGAAGAVNPIEATKSVLTAFADHYGGLWVGGRATLTDTMLTFEPNVLNRLLHENGEALRLDLPLAAIDQVATRFGWFTGIIDVTAQGAVFSLRCYGSKGFAAKIDAAVAALARTDGG